jgi:hypothetical protein
MNKPAITGLAEQVYAIIQPHSTGTTRYSDVCGRLTGRWANLEPDSPLLAEALGLIVHRCRDAEPPLPALSAVVVHKGGDRMPCNGYFTAAHPGIDDPLKRQIAWARELADVHKATYPRKARRPVDGNVAVGSGGPRAGPRSRWAAVDVAGAALVVLRDRRRRSL